MNFVIFLFKKKISSSIIKKIIKKADIYYDIKWEFIKEKYNHYSTIDKYNKACITGNLAFIIEITEEFLSLIEISLALSILVNEREKKDKLSNDTIIMRKIIFSGFSTACCATKNKIVGYLYGILIMRLDGGIKLTFSTLYDLISNTDYNKTSKFLIDKCYDRYEEKPMIFNGFNYLDQAFIENNEEILYYIIDKYEEDYDAILHYACVNNGIIIINYLVKKYDNLKKKIGIINNKISEFSLFKYLILNYSFNLEKIFRLSFEKGKEHYCTFLLEKGLIIKDVTISNKFLGSKKFLRLNNINLICEYDYEKTHSSESDFSDSDELYDSEELEESEELEKNESIIKFSEDSQDSFERKHPAAAKKIKEITDTFVKEMMGNIFKSFNLSDD